MSKELYLALWLAKEAPCGQFSVQYAKINLSRLIVDALAGGEVLIARGNVPAVRLVPVFPVGKRHFEALKGKITVDERFDEPLPDEEASGWNLA